MWYNVVPTSVNTLLPIDCFNVSVVPNRLHISPFCSLLSWHYFPYVLYYDFGNSLRVKNAKPHFFVRLSAHDLLSAKKPFVIFSWNFAQSCFYKTLSKYEFREIQLHDSHTSLHWRRKEISSCTAHSFQPNCVKFHYLFIIKSYNTWWMSVLHTSRQYKQRFIRGTYFCLLSELTI